MRRTQIILIDSDMRRRAKVAFEMTNLRSYVLPLEDVAEICGTWPEEAVVLIEDSRDNIARLDRVMARQAQPLPFIAFSAALSAQAEARARARGAVAYLASPCDPAALNAAVAAAQTAEKPERLTPAQIVETAGVAAAIIAIGQDPRSDYLITDPLPDTHSSAAAMKGGNLGHESPARSRRKAVDRPLTRVL